MQNNYKQMIDYQAIVSSVYEKIKMEQGIGKPASYIEELAKVNPDKFGVYLQTIDGQSYGFGDYEEKFSIQSIAKVLSLSLAYSIEGSKIWSRIGVEPSGTAFNSLVQLESDKGIPRNPFINGGALVVSDILLSILKNASEEFIQFVIELASDNTINYSEEIALSESKNGYRNAALCNFIKSFGNIKNEPEEVLDFYFHLCSIKMSCKQLSQTFLYLANNGINKNTGEQILNSSRTKRLNALMQTCGFYDESGEFSFKVGLPGKSGVGGGIFAIYPGKYSIAVWSPPLNEKGNSHKGMRFLEEFTTESGVSIF